MSTEDLQKYLDFAKNLALEAGAIAKRAAEDTALHVVSKDDNSPVTAADEAINRLVIERVQQTFSNIGVLGEEESLNAEPTSGLLWVCDPIDGTIPFTLGIPISTFCLALVEDGEPVVGVVYHFGKDLLYAAAKGLGAFCNGEKLLPPQNDPLLILPVETWHAAPNDIGMHVAKLRAAKYQMPNFTSSAYESTLIMRGKLKGLLYAGNKPWDIAAQYVALNELGFEVTDIYGRSQRYDGLIKGAFIGRRGLYAELFGA
ncbi:MAG TPA: inositol monophosphatase family protein [Candidatus Saccharimonadales bacterium]